MKTINNIIKTVLIFTLILIIPIQLTKAVDWIDEAINDSANFLNSTVNHVLNSSPPHSFPADTTYYQPGSNKIFISQNDEYKKDVVQHEYGHAVIRDLYGAIPFVLYPTCRREFYLGVPHFANLPMSCVQGAFNEGWATAFSNAVRNNHTTDDVKYENETEFEATAGALESGPYTEGTVAMILWDIIDSKNSSDSTPNEDDDDINGKFILLWNVTKNNEPMDIMEFYNDWIDSGLKFTEYKNRLYDIYATHGIDKPDEDNKGPYNDWYHFHHDLRRTGLTTLRGDMTQSEAVYFKLHMKGGLSGDTYDKPSISDLDEDGYQDVIVAVSQAGTDGKVFGLEYQKNPRGFRMKFEPPVDVGTPIDEAPSIDDIDGDGVKEIVFGTDENEIWALTRDGKKLWDPFKAENQSSLVTIGHTAIADIDLDGNKEVIFADYSASSTFQAHLYVLRKQGVNLL